MAIEAQDIDMEEYNRRVARWGSELAGKIRSSIRMLTSKGKGDLVKSLRLKTGKWFGEIDKLSYHFERHGVFLHKGVGRGYQMSGGKVIRVSGSKDIAHWKKYALSKNREMKPKVLRGYMMERRPVEWFNPVVQDNIEQLADMVTEMNADKAVNATKILIN